MLLLYRTIQSNLCRLLAEPVPGISRLISHRFLSIAKMNSEKNSVSATLFDHKQDSSSCGKIERKRYLSKRRNRIDLGSEKRTGETNTSQLECSPMADFTSKQDEFSVPTQFGKKKNTSPPRVKRSKSGQSYSKYVDGTNNAQCDNGSIKVEPFDICLSNDANSGVFKASFHEKDEENLNDECTIEGTRQGVLLRPGMVLLKNHISHSSQVKIVKTCRELGMGPGGFYRPGYKYGAKLRLQMMCLGLNWDPQTRKYEDLRPVDCCKPPDIPCEFNTLVRRAIQDAHALIREDFKLSNVEDMLPAMSPDICIVNFYTISGRLGLHQDRDESAESLHKGLPVVSFSVGDSAEFLYGDQRDVDKAEKVVLESGDVLIFGGQSRHIFHGVTSIIPNSAPKALLEQCRLHPGRLNLTFRRY